MVKITTDSEEEEYKFQFGIRICVLLLSLVLLALGHALKVIDHRQESMAKLEIDKWE